MCNSSNTSVQLIPCTTCNTSQHAACLPSRIQANIEANIWPCWACRLSDYRAGLANDIVSAFAVFDSYLTRYKKIQWNSIHYDDLRLFAIKDAAEQKQLYSSMVAEAIRALCAGLDGAVLHTFWANAKEFQADGNGERLRMILRDRVNAARSSSGAWSKHIMLAKVFVTMSEIE
ncbi:hypothetical protein LTR95_009893 [Oleoguttula sp. CCFEE 5521]